MVKQKPHKRIYSQVLFDIIDTENYLIRWILRLLRLVIHFNGYFGNSEFQNSVQPRLLFSNVFD